MPLYDCLCDSGHKFERLLKMDAIRNKLECPECGDAAYTTVSPVRSKLDGTDPSLPGAYMKWANDREKRAVKARSKDKA